MDLPQSGSTVHRVANSTEFKRAFAEAQSGDRIELAPGRYSKISVVNRNFDTPITITSEDPNNPAVLGDSWSMRNVSGINIHDIELVQDNLLNSGSEALLFLRNVKNIHVSDVNIVGYLPTAAEGADPNDTSTSRTGVIADRGYGMGLRVAGGENLSFDNVDIADVNVSTRFEDVQGLSFTNSELTGMRDGITFFDSAQLLIEGNYLHDMRPFMPVPSNQYDHPDFIQYWGIHSQNGLDDIVIRDNLFIQPEGSIKTQTIFGHRRGADDNVRFTDFTIEGNVIFNAHVNGISISDVAGLKIIDNILLPNTPGTTARPEIPRVRIDGSSRVDLIDNVVTTVSGDSFMAVGGSDLIAKGGSESGNRVLSLETGNPLFWGPILDAVQARPENFIARAGSNVQKVEAILGPIPVDQSPPPTPITPPGGATELTISGTAYDLTAFTHENGGQFSVEDNGTTLRQTTNAWTQAEAAGPITVTANTVLRFDFASSNEGEIHGVEFDRNNRPTGEHGFQVYGSQNNIYHQDFHNYSGSGTTTYEIPVGQYFTGSFDSLVFFSDDDKRQGANSTYSNIALFESAAPPPPPPPPVDPDPVIPPSAPALTISGTAYDLTAFTRENGGQFSLENNGTTLRQTTNAWTQAEASGPITVTANTVLRFDFSSSDEGEIHGVEFDNDNRPSDAFGFQVYGSQNNIYHQDFHDYSGSGTKTYEIPVGQFFTGSFDSLVFFSDDDKKRGANSTYSNIELFERAAPPPPPAVPAQPKTLTISQDDYAVDVFAHQNTGTYQLEDDGAKLVLTTDGWAEASTGGDIVVRENTVLRFDFSSSDEGEIHGVEFDNNNRPSGEHGFQLYGSQNNIYHQDFHDYSGSGTKTYEIPVGQFFTGSFDSLVFFADDDKKGGANSVFSNIELFDIG